MRHWTRIGVATALVLAVPAADALAMRLQPRPDWRVGVGWGYGKGVFESPSGDDQDYRGGTIPQMRFGRSLGDHFMLGLEYQAWMIEFGDIPTKYRRGLQGLMLALDWFPGRPDGVSGGIYLRAAAGMGWAVNAVVPVTVGEAQGHGERNDEWGVATSLGAGYEFWIGSNVTTGVGVSLDYLDIGETFVDRGAFGGIILDLNLYF